MKNEHLSALLFVMLVGCGADDTQQSAREPSPHHGQDMFAKLDADGDGALTSAELEGATGPAKMLAQHFADLDVDGDGQLVHDEIAAGMEKHHGDHADHHAAVLDQFDADGDGELDAEEREAAHRHHFDAADTNHNGELSVDELKAAPGPGPMLAEHLGDIDASGNGTLSYDEITTAMEAHHAH